jgi:hypothetical protein
MTPPYTWTFLGSLGKNGFFSILRVSRPSALALGFRATYNAPGCIGALWLSQ